MIIGGVRKDKRVLPLLDPRGDQASPFGPPRIDLLFFVQSNQSEKRTIARRSAAKGSAGLAILRDLLGLVVNMRDCSKRANRRGPDRFQANAEDDPNALPMLLHQTNRCAETQRRKEAIGKAFKKRLKRSPMLRREAWAKLYEGRAEPIVIEQQG